MQPHGPSTPTRRSKRIAACVLFRQMFAASKGLAALPLLAGYAPTWCSLSLGRHGGSAFLSGPKPTLVVFLSWFLEVRSLSLCISQQYACNRPQHIPRGPTERIPNVAPAPFYYLLLVIHDVTMAPEIRAPMRPSRSLQTRAALLPCRQPPRNIPPDVFWCLLLSSSSFSFFRFFLATTVLLYMYADCCCAAFVLEALHLLYA